MCEKYPRSIAPSLLSADSSIILKHIFPRQKSDCYLSTTD